MFYQGFYKVATCAPKVHVGDPHANIEIIIDALKEAKEKKVGAVVFPELSVCGYTCGDLLAQTYLLDAVNASILHLLQNNPFDGIVILGAPITFRRNLYNCAIVIQQDQILGVIPKHNLPNDAEFYEARWFNRGNEIIKHHHSMEFLGRDVPFGNIVFDDNVHGVSFGVEVCMDLWVADSPSVALALNGADIIFNLSTSTELLNKGRVRRDLVKVQSSKLVSGYVYASSGVYESTTDGVFSGHCMISQLGEIMTESKIFCRDDINMTVGDIDVAKIQFLRRKSTTFRETSNDNIQSIPHVPFNVIENQAYTFENAIDATPFVPKENTAQAFEEIMNIQTTGLAKRLLHTNAQTIVVGVSGGLDSTLALLLAAKTCDLIGMPRTAVHAYTIRGFGTSERTHSNAFNLMKALGVTTNDLDLTASVLSHFETIGHDPKQVDVTYENAQARERTNILMNLANKHHGLVLGTGNLSELALGWCTYNGDQMSMYSINGGVPKSLVKFMVKHFMLLDTDALAAQAEDASVIANTLADILATPISPELINTAQHTEDIIGKYDVHDFILYHMLVNGDTESRIAYLLEKAFGHEMSHEDLTNYRQIFFRRFFSQQFKRSALPDGPKVLDISLSPRTDWRMPSDAVYRSPLQ